MRADFRHGERIILDIYNRASRVLNLDDSDPIQLEAHAGFLRNEAQRMLRALIGLLPPDSDWIQESQMTLDTLIRELDDAIVNANNTESVKLPYFMHANLVQLSASLS